jgi:hypothetical protein
MALKNSHLQKLGSAATSPNASGHSQMQWVQPTVALPAPGPRDSSDSTWPARNAAYQQSIQITQKFSQDWE